MTSTQDKTHNANHPSNQTPPIDLNALHTPHKLAAFIVKVPSRKAEFAFLFNEDKKNSDSTINPNSSQQFLNPNNTQFMNVSMTLMPPSIIKKKSKSKKKHKKKAKANKKIKQQYRDHHNKDEQDMQDDVYNPQNDSVGPPQNERKENENDLPTTVSSKTNVFNESKFDTDNIVSIDDDIEAVSTVSSLRNIGTIETHHHNDISTTSTVVSDTNDIPIPAPSNIDAIGTIPVPMEPVMPSRFDDLTSITAADSFKYEVSMMDTPTINDNDIPILGINQISIDPHIAQLSDDLESDTDYEDDTKNADSAPALVEDSTSSSSSSTDEDDDDDVNVSAFGAIASYLEEEEENICIRIGKVLYENSWTGDMISSSTEFSRREYNALLDVGNIPTDSYISNLVWKIIFYSQKKTKDDLINEDKEHIKWYWFDSSDMDSDWKWRKYNVIICQWITQQFGIYLDESKNNDKSINFKDCQQKLIELHREKNTKKHSKTKPHDEDKDEEKEEKQQKTKKITIDAYFDKNNNYDHFLLIERNENKNILIWHKITKNSNDGDEYYREIRLDQKLLGIKQDMIIPNYQPNPSPFAIPPQLAVDS